MSARVSAAYLEKERELSFMRDSGARAPSRAPRLLAAALDVERLLVVRVVAEVVADRVQRGRQLRAVLGRDRGRGDGVLLDKLAALELERVVHADALERVHARDRVAHLRRPRPQLVGGDVAERVVAPLPALRRRLDVR